MACSENSRRLNVADNLQRLAIENENAISTADVEVLLVRIGRQCEVARKRNVGLDELLQKLPVFREHLNATVFAIGDVYGSILGDSNRMNDAELLWPGIGERFWRHDLAIIIIHGLVAERAPHPLECAAVRVEYSNAMIAVSIRDEEFVSLRIYPLVGRPVEILRIRVTLALIALPDLQHQFSVLRELQQLIVRNRLESRQPVCRARVPAEPHEPLVVDVDSMLAFRPFVARGGAAPGLDVISGGIEHDDRRRCLRSVCRLERSGTVQNPHVVLCIDGHARGIAELPLRWNLRPRAIDFEGRQASSLRLRENHGEKEQSAPAEICAFHVASSLLDTLILPLSIWSKLFRLARKASFPAATCSRFGATRWRFSRMSRGTLAMLLSSESDRSIITSSIIPTPSK